MKKRLLSFMLTLAMVVSLCAGMTVTASAADEIDLRDMKEGDTVSVGTVLTDATKGKAFLCFHNPVLLSRRSVYGSLPLPQEHI